MSFSRLCRRTIFFPSSHKPRIHSPFHSRCLNEAAKRYDFVGGSNFRPIQGYKLSIFELYRSFSELGIGNLKRPSYASLGSYRQYATQFTSSAIEKKCIRMLIILTGVAFGMLGGSYAAVPLYRIWCNNTGNGGTTQRKESVEQKIARHSEEGTVTTREIVVQFNADVADGMPWKFSPTQKEVRVKPGESALAFYTVENQSSAPITGTSTYNVTPMKAGVYFNKIQCFCFEKQRLLPGEQIDMPVFFYIDPEFETDPKMGGVNNLILSYTFFKYEK